MTSFTKKLNSAFNKKNLQDTLGTEGMLQKTQQLINQAVTKIENKNNRYVFYCPDLPFPNSMVKIIYQHANAIAKLGFKTVILHDMEGFKPSYLGYIDVNPSITISGLSVENKGSKKISAPSYTFQPFDTVIIPDSYWTQMTNLLALTIPINRVVLCLGYGGLATIEPGNSWNAIKFNQVWTITDEVSKTYEDLYFEPIYSKTGYHLAIDKIKAKSGLKDKRLVVALNCRFKDQAQRLVNIFYRRYPALTGIEFAILKNNNYGDYLNMLRGAKVHVMIDPYQAAPASIMESLLCDTPTVVFGGMNQNMFTDNIPGVTIYEGVRYETEMAGILADTIMQALTNETQVFSTDPLVESISTLFTEEEFDKNVLLAVEKNQAILMAQLNYVTTNNPNTTQEG